jgi:hypothetical protein
MVWRIVDSTTLVLRHLDIAPADDEWSEFCADLRSLPLERMLVYAPGGATPSTRQRSAVVDAFKSKPNGCLTAVLTNSKLTRGAAIAIHWFVPTVRAFDDTDLQGALRFIGLSGDDGKRVLATLEQLATLLPPQP